MATIEMPAADMAEGVRLFVAMELNDWKNTLPDEDKHFADDKKIVCVTEYGWWFKLEYKKCIDWEK